MAKQSNTAACVSTQIKNDLKLLDEMQKNLSLKQSGPNRTLRSQ